MSNGSRESSGPATKACGSNCPIAVKDKLTHHGAPRPYIRIESGVVPDFQYPSYLLSWQMPNLLIIRPVNVPPMLTLVKVYVKSLNAFVLLEETSDFLMFVILIQIVMLIFWILQFTCKLATIS